MISRAMTNPEFSNQNKTHKRVLYIDTDTTFTAYLTAGLILNNNYQTSNDMNSMSDHKDKKSNNSIKNNNKGEADYNDNDNDNKKVVDENSNDASRIINTKIKNQDERLVQVFLPSEGRFESLLGDAIASMPEASIVIFDSLNSFYNMYPGSWYETEFIEEPVQGTIQKASDETQESKEHLWMPRAKQKKTPSDPLKEKNTMDGEAWSKPKSQYTIGRLNHLLSVFIMLLVQHGIYYKIPVLVTSMVRYKKVSEDLWVKAPACRRLLNQKSVVRLSVEMLNDNDLSVKIMKHPLIEQQTIVYPNVGISLLNP
jgi:hypothetical protein